MHTIETIKTFAEAYGFEPSQAKKSFKELPSLLHADERLKGLLEAQFREANNRTTTGYGLAAATDRRILCYRKSILGTVTSEEFPLAKITGISYRKGIVLGSVIITVAGNQVILEGCLNKEGEKFANTVKELLASANAPLPPANPSDPLDQLEKLFEMKQKGILTEEEFAAAKAKLLP